jgi:hypothetical protein
MEPGFRRMFDAAEIEYIRKMNNDMWTPELDRELMHDLQKYVVATGDIMGLFLLCQKYNCTIGSIEERLETIHRQSLERLESRWERFRSKHTEECVVLS